jgi:hypothetical protein
MDKSITNEQLEKLFGKDVKVTSYKDLDKIKSLPELFKKIKALIILYEYKNAYGHWVLVIKTVNKKGEKVIEFFDPYGVMPDRQLKGFTKKTREKFGMKYPTLTKLLLDSGFPIEFNNHRLQKLKKGVSTCGRWCAVRALFRDLDIDTFAKEMKSKKSMSPDEVVVSLTPFFDH